MGGRFRVWCSGRIFDGAKARCTWLATSQFGQADKSCKNLSPLGGTEYTLRLERSAERIGGSNPSVGTSIKVDMNKIVCAATKYNIGGVELILADARHMYQNQAAILEFFIKEQKEIEEIEQGFIDRYGMFHDRESAFVIARDAGQIIGETYGNTLYSENLY